MRFKKGVMIERRTGQNGKRRMINEEVGRIEE